MLIFNKKQHLVDRRAHVRNAAVVAILFHRRLCRLRYPCLRHCLRVEAISLTAFPIGAGNMPRRIWHSVAVRLEAVSAFIAV